MRLRFRGQVLLLFAMLFLAGWALASMLLSNHLTAVVEADLVRHGRVLATNLAGWSEEPALTEESVDLRRLLERTREFNPEVTYVFVLGPNGNVVASTLGPPFPSALGRATLGRDRTLLRTEEGPIVDIRAPILQGRGGEVHVGYSRAALHAGVVRLRMALWLIAVPVLLVGLLGLWFLSGYVTRPARDLADAVRRFGSGDLDARARAGGPGELSVLARAFNEMAATHQRQAAELRFLSEYNRRLIDNLGAALYVVDGDLELEFANREVAESRDRLAGRRCHEALYGRAEPCPACPALGALRTGRPESGVREAPGDLVYEETAIPLDGSPTARQRVVMVRRDVTEATRLRAEHARSERFTAIGELAAAVAHEVNNPLDGMRSLLRLVEADPQTGRDVRETLDMVQGGLARIEMCVRRLLTIAAEAPHPQALGAFGAHVAEALALARPTLERAGIEARIEIPRGLPAIAVDPNRFAQLLLNLLLMAADGVPRGSRLVVRAEAGPDGGVHATFAAEGPPATEGARGRLFLPFFVARPTDRGSVLGLVVSRRIAEEHGGSVEAEEGEDGTMAYVLRLASAGAAVGRLDPEGAR